jgi:hypothetical protein
LRSAAPRLQLLAVCLVVGALALLALSAGAASPPIPLSAYWQKLKDTHALAVGLEGAAPGVARPQLAALADEWTAITSVTLADGSPLPVDNSVLVAQLRADPAQPAQVADLAQAMATQGAGWPAPRHTASDLDSLTRILAQPEFQWPVAQPNWLDQLRDRLLAWIGRLLAQFLSGTRLGSDGVTLLGQALALLALLAVAGVLAYVLRGLFLNFAPEVSLPEGAAPGDDALTAESASQRARALSAGGDYRAAVRYLYLSALLHLEEAGLLRYDRSLTNREYLRSVAGRPELAAELREVVDVFDRVWYGFDALSPAAYADYSARVAGLREQK